MVLLVGVGFTLFLLLLLLTVDQSSHSDKSVHSHSAPIQESGFFTSIECGSLASFWSFLSSSSRLRCRKSCLIPQLLNLNAETSSPSFPRFRPVTARFGVVPSVTLHRGVSLRDEALSALLRAGTNLAVYIRTPYEKKRNENMGIQHYIFLIYFRFSASACFL